jgi:hypothetical protein
LDRPPGLPVENPHEPTWSNSSSLERWQKVLDRSVSLPRIPAALVDYRFF